MIFSRSAAGAGSQAQLRRTSALSATSRSYSLRQGAHSSRWTRILFRSITFISPSRYSYTRSSTSRQSVSCGSPQLTTSSLHTHARSCRAVLGPHRGGHTTVAGVVLEQAAQLAPATVQTRHHGADRRAHDVRDLAVRE